MGSTVTDGIRHSPVLPSSLPPSPLPSSPHSSLPFSLPPSFPVSPSLPSSPEDSGYAPKSQESFSHSQPKSLEGYSTSQELSLQEGGAEYPRDFSSSSLPHGQVEGVKRPAEKKEEGGGARPSQRSGYEYGGSPRAHKRSGSYTKLNRTGEGNFLMSPARSGVGKLGDFYQPPRGMDQHPRGIDIAGRGPRDHYGSFPGGPRDPYGGVLGGSYGEHEGFLRTFPPPGLPGDFERSYPPDWRRSYTLGEFEHRPAYGSRGGYGDINQEPPHLRGRFEHGMDAYRGRFGTRRDRLMMEEARMFRTKSHERMDYVGAPRGALRPDEEFREPPIDYYLSQPNPSYFPYDRPPFGIPPPGSHGYWPENDWMYTHALAICLLPCFHLPVSPFMPVSLCSPSLPPSLPSSLPPSLPRSLPLSLPPSFPPSLPRPTPVPRA